MKKDRFFPVKLLVLIFMIVTLGLAAEFFYEFTNAVYPEGHPQVGQPVQWADLTLNANMVRAAASPFARAYNNILALLLTFIAIAIPITANMYTPKLITLFLRDRLNLIVLCAGGVLAAHSVFAASMAFDVFVGRISFWISCFGAIAGWAVIIPYYYYVLQFLNPETIIERVKESILAELKMVARGTRNVSVDQRELSHKIAHLGSVILQSVGRSDRDVAVDSVRAMAEVLRTYAGVKPGLRPVFFQVDQDVFTGLSRAAIDLLNSERIWVEQKCLQQLDLAYSSALSKMPDAVSTISDVVKDLARDVALKGDRAVLSLYVRFMNTFLREAIAKKDVHAIYDVFYQYRSLARKVMDHFPDVARAMVGHFKYYADMARAAGMAFIYELASYELADLCELAYEHEHPDAGEYALQALLGFQGIESSVRLVKSRAILGAYLMGRGNSRAQGFEAVARSLGSVPKSLLAQARSEILATTERTFWEVTDRQVNFDYVDEKRRPKVAEFLDRLMS